MKLSEDDAILFYKLHPSLLLYVNNKLKIIDKIKSVEDMTKVTPVDKIPWVTIFQFKG